SFEYGTYGETLIDEIRCMRTMILENQLYWSGASKPAKKKIELAFKELFAPTGIQWREKAVADADQAFQGILRAEGFFD
ncbi:MAG: M14 family metallopeptidase, partial [Anaerolineaceae bacterium]|nr:M14 family metallopeptidase [Anaerolineaceae bacterium]